MSNWTHVAGIIRIDNGPNLPMRNTNAVLDFFHDLLGKECLFESDEEVWNDWDKNPDKYLPGGSDGTLQLSVWENPRPDYAFTHTVSIFGDLRDHCDAKSIIEWFQKKIEGINKLSENDEHCMLSVRQAVITVDNEVNGTKTWTMPRFE